MASAPNTATLPQTPHARPFAAPLTCTALGLALAVTPALTLTLVLVLPAVASVSPRLRLEPALVVGTAASELVSAIVWAALDDAGAALALALSLSLSLARLTGGKLEGKTVTLDGTSVAVTGQMVVVTETVSMVVRPTGQEVTDGGHEVMVKVLVEKTVLVPQAQVALAEVHHALSLEWCRASWIFCLGLRAWTGAGASESGLVKRRSSQSGSKRQQK